jgi:glycine dehydrogenase subunit 1
MHGPLDLSRTFPQLGQAALVCVTETHTKADIDRLADAVAAAVEDRR